MRNNNYDGPNPIPYMILLFIATIVFILLIVSGCQKPCTLENCMKIYPPPKDVNQANAEAALQNAIEMGKQRVKAQASIDWVKLVCVGGCISSIAAIVLGTTGLKSLGFSGLLICIAGISLIQFYQMWPIWFAYVGGGIALTAGGYAVWTHSKALKEVVWNVEEIKTTTSQTGPALHKDLIKEALAKQSPATKALVAKIRKKIDDKD